MPRGNLYRFATHFQGMPCIPRAVPTLSTCHVRLNARVVHGSFAPMWPCPMIPRLRSSEAWVKVLATQISTLGLLRTRNCMESSSRASARLQILPIWGREEAVEVSQLAWQSWTLGEPISTKAVSPSETSSCTHTCTPKTLSRARHNIRTHVVLPDPHALRSPRHGSLSQGCGPACSNRQ